MQLQVRHLVMCLVLGAATTVAVSWGCSYFAGILQATDTGAVTASERPRWRIGEWQGLGRSAISSRSDFFRPKPDDVIVRFPWSRTSKPAPPVSNRETSFVERREFAAGWPFRSMMWWQDIDWTNVPIPSGPNTTPVLTARNPQWAIPIDMLPMPVPVDLPTQRVIPLCPIPYGFTLDALFYGLFWWLIGSCAWLLKRRWRRRRNRCPLCAYDLSATAHDRCPECGEELRSPFKDRRERRFAVFVLGAWSVVLGIVTTVGVAWGCALGIDVTRGSIEYGWASDIPATWLIQRQRTAGADRVIWTIDDEYEDRINHQRSQDRMRASARPRTLTPEQEELLQRRKAPVEEYLADQWTMILNFQRALAKPRPELINTWGDNADRAADVPHERVDRAILEDARGWPFKAMRCTAGVRVDIRRDDFNKVLDANVGWIRDGVLSSAYTGHPTTLRILPTRVMWLGFLANSTIYTTAWAVVLWLTFRRRGASEAGRENANIGLRRNPSLFMMYI